MFKNLIIFSVILIFVSSYSFSQIKGDLKETVVAKVGNENITYKMIEKAYSKNINKEKQHFHELTKDSIFEFVDLFINYRLKVHDAILKGFDKEQDVLNDIENNRKILAKSFYYEKKLTEPYVNKSIDRRKKEYKVAIIIKSFREGDKKAKRDAKLIATRALERVTKDGEEFGKVAMDVSDDRKSAENGGKIPGYITSGKVQREIEDAIYSLDKGEIYPELIETNYGFFVLKVIDIKPRELVYTSHILLKFGIEKDSAQIIKKADSLLTLLKNGADFAKLAKENSDDKSTYENGGSFGVPYSRSTGLEPSGKPFLPHYEKALFNLNDGEISDKVITDFGIHIIKRDSTAEIDIKQEKEELESTYKKIYFNIDKNYLLDSLIESYGINVDMEVLAKVVTFMDTSFSSNKESFGENVPKEFYSKKLYTFIGQTFTVEDYINQMNSEKAVYGFGLDTNGLKKSIYVMNRGKVFELATKNLEKKYPEFRDLINEFKDGILLFKAEAEEVWNKLKFDSSLAKKYYDTLSVEYLTKKEYDISEIYVKDKEEAQKIWEEINNGADFEKYASEKTMREGYREKNGNWGRVTVDNNYLAKTADKKNALAGDVLMPTKYENGYSIIKVNKVYPERKKTFKEAIPDIAPAVQDIQQKKLTEKWIKEIRNKIDVKVYNDKLMDVVKTLR